jgi:hypothetical protein
VAAAMSAEIAAREAAEEEHISLKASHDAMAEGHATLLSELSAAAAAQESLFAESGSTTQGLQQEVRRLGAELEASLSQLEVARVSAASVQSEVADSSEQLAAQAAARNMLTTEKAALEAELQQAMAAREEVAAAMSAEIAAREAAEEEHISLKASHDAMAEAHVSQKLDTNAAVHASQVLAKLQSDLSSAGEAVAAAEAAAKAAQKNAKREGLKAAALKTMLEEHSATSENNIAATAEAEAQKDSELVEYREALGTARVRVQKLEQERGELLAAKSTAEAEALQYRRVSTEWELESGRIHEWAEKLKLEGLASNVSIDELERDNVELKKQLEEAIGAAVDSSSAETERDELRQIVEQLTGQLDHRGMELIELRRQLGRAEELVGGSREEAELSERAYGKLQARLVEAETIRERESEALRKRIDLKTAESAKHAATVMRLQQVIESFQLERQQQEISWRAELHAVVQERNEERYVSSMPANDYARA